MCLVLEGRFTEYNAAGRFACAPRSVLFYPPDFSHREEFEAPASRCLVVEISRRWIDRTEGPLWGRSGVQVTGGPLADLAARMYRETRIFDRASPLVVEGLMLEFLGLATRRGGAAPPRNVVRLARVRDALHARFREDISLGPLARDAGLTPAALARQFRREYGCTVGTYLRRLRVRHAARLLTETELPLSHVAVEAGFCDQSHLCRVFRWFTGTSPGEYRRRAG
jgi:AraC-like DNA-binding protein